CSASFLSRGSTPRRAGPRFFGAPASSPRSRAARHVVRCEEYSPSRRSNAPTAPGVLQASASRTIFRLYSTVNRRRVAFATTSIAGPPRACSNALIALRSCLALDSKLPGGHCLTHVGREGGPLLTPSVTQTRRSNNCRLVASRLFAVLRPLRARDESGEPDVRVQAWVWRGRPRVCVHRSGDIPLPLPPRIIVEAAMSSLPAAEERPIEATVQGVSFRPAVYRLHCNTGSAARFAIRFKACS